MSSLFNQGWAQKWLGKEAVYGAPMDPLRKSDFLLLARDVHALAERVMQIEAKASEDEKAFEAYVGALQLKEAQKDLAWIRQCVRKVQDSAEATPRINDLERWINELRGEVIKLKTGNTAVSAQEAFRAEVRAARDGAVDSDFSSKG